MTLSMSQASITPIIRALTNLTAILDKAAAFAVERKIDPSVLINFRLAPDMLPLSKQVQIASDITKGGIARLAGVETPSFADTEMTFEDLKERIAKTIAFIKTVGNKQLDGSEGKTITLKVGGNDLSFSGQDYLLGFVLPNLYFHTTIAYAILRHNGLDIGKKDYLGTV